LKTRNPWLIRGPLFGLMVIGLGAAAYVPGPDGAGVRPGVLPSGWIVGGPKCMESTEFQVHEYNPDFYILRQSGCSHYEKPFLYLLFGSESALLIDTGAGTTEVADVVVDVVKKWSERNGRESIPLTVAHSHNHSDHVAGDEQFKGLPNVTFVEPELESVIEHWGFTNWPDEVVQIDLGDRVLDVFGIPGHQQASIALYDHQTGVLLSGDTVYPGRLYINDPPAFIASVNRMVEFTKSRVVSHVLGCHIEQTATPYLEYPIGSIYQPNERRLEFSRGILLELQDAVQSMDGDFKRLALRDLTIYPVGPDIWGELRGTRRDVETEQRKTQWDQSEAQK
jgi:hydroxyacylglutathione hydrolase